MTDWFLGLVPVHGLWLIALVTFASCLALPMPASVVMMAAGGFAASGDLVLWQVVTAAILGAVAGDQLGFGIGRIGGASLVERLSLGARAPLILRAQGMMEARGSLAVFLSRWLFSPLGPYVNLLSGALRQRWTPFTSWGVSGEVVWCSVYVVIGWYFAGNLSAASDLLGSILGLVATGAAVLVLGAWLLALARRERSED